MAAQMFVALLAAFGAGFAMFPAHWSWVVLTAFIVCSGARGRSDAVYKAVLRLTGAVAGTLAALTWVWLPTGPAGAVAIFGVLFFGLLLRDLNYAYWAGCMTLILALLAHVTDASRIALLGVRIAAILTGAVCALGAAWFIFPIRTEAVVRRRIGDALRALDDLVACTHGADSEKRAKLAAFEQHVAHLENAAAPVRWHRRITACTLTPEHPANWIDLVKELSVHTRSFRAEEGQRANVRRAIGMSRRSLAAHGKPGLASGELAVGASLSRLRDTLAARNGMNSVDSVAIAQIRGAGFPPAMP